MKTNKNVLIIAEIYGKEIHKITYELLNKGKELAIKLNSKVNVLVLAYDANVEELCSRGADKVYFIKDKCFYLPEEYLFKENISGFIKEYKPGIVLFGASNFGRSLAPRVAAALKTGLTADCTELSIDNEGNLIQIRPAFSGNIFAHIKTSTSPQIATIRYKEFNEAKKETGNKINIEILSPYFQTYSETEIIDIFTEDDFDITEADIVVAGGRGLKSKEDIRLLEELAKILGGATGASRALVDTGMIGKQHQVGYSGNRVKPDIYIAIGISGAPQHLAGMKESNLIIAINSDPSAPIFNIADIGYVGDFHEVIPKIIQNIKNKRTEGCNG